MVCADCWYAAGKGKKIEYWNPKSEHFAEEVDVSFECSLFSDSNLPDPEA